MGTVTTKTRTRLKRKRSIRKKICGTSTRPRLSVFRSAKHIYAQVIDDKLGQTLAAASSLENISNESDLDEDGDSNSGKKPIAKQVGNMIAKRAIGKGIKKVVFDRNGFLYHGRIKALSDGARKAGLDF